MDTVMMWMKTHNLKKWVTLWLVGLVVMIEASGCSGAVSGAQATYRALVSEATATAAAKGYSAQSAAPLPTSELWAHATQIKKQFNYASKQAEDRSFTTIAVGWLVLLTVAGLTTLGVWLYAKRLQSKIRVEEAFIYDAGKQARRRF